jgi:hypothetical protein
MFEKHSTLLERRWSSRREKVKDNTVFAVSKTTQYSGDPYSVIMGGVNSLPLSERKGIVLKVYYFIYTRAISVTFWEKTILVRTVTQTNGGEVRRI